MTTSMKTVTKLFLTLGIVIMSVQIGFGQVSFSHSIGASYYFSSYASAPAIMYSPRLNLIQVGDESTISIGTHLGLGISYNSQAGASSFALDLPIMAELNLGNGASKEANSSFGGFFGLGFGISKLGSASAWGGDYNDAAGLVVNGGVRFHLNERPLGVRVAYLLNAKEGFASVLGIGAMYTLGRR